MNPMESLQNDVRQFWTEKLPYQFQPVAPTTPDAETFLAMLASMGDEFQELHEAAHKKDLPGWIDGLADLIYTALGSAIACGVELGPIWQAVQKANMAKLPAAPGTNGRKTAEGKSCKPVGWVAPDVEALLDEQTNKALNDSGWSGDLV